MRSVILTYLRSHADNYLRSNYGAAVSAVLIMNIASHFTPSGSRPPAGALRRLFARYRGVAHHRLLKRHALHGPP